MSPISSNSLSCFLSVIQDINTFGVKNWRIIANGKGKLAEASEEGQGPRRDVEPMMMTMMMMMFPFSKAYVSLTPGSCDPQP
jgi:hypothetical protein